jgi:hypothetical protein
MIKSLVEIVVDGRYSGWVLPETLSKISAFPGLQRVVIGIYKDPLHSSKFTKADITELSKAQEEIETYMNENFNHIKVTFEDMPV